MSAATLKRRFQALLACLLILCLSPVAMPTQWLYGRDDLGAGPEDVLFVPGFANSAAAVFAVGTRNRFNGSDDLNKAAITPEQAPTVFARKSSSYPFNFDADISFRADRTTLSVRAPPGQQYFCL